MRLKLQDIVFFGIGAVLLAALYGTMSFEAQAGGMGDRAIGGGGGGGGTAFTGGTLTSGLTISNVATDITTGTNEALTLVANGTGAIVLNDSVTSGAITLSNVATDITTGTDEDLVVAPNGTGSVVLRSGDSVVDIQDGSSNVRGTITADTTNNIVLFKSGGTAAYHMGTALSAVGRTDSAAATAVVFQVADNLSSTSTGTVLFSVYGSGLVKNGATTATCADSGDGNPGTLSLGLSTANVVYITNADANGCTVTVSETNALTGTQFRIWLVSNAGGTVDFADQANVLSLSAAYAMTADDFLCLEYVDLANDEFQECGRSVN